jgi:hypothetical protein
MLSVDWNTSLTCPKPTWMEMLGQHSHGCNIRSLSVTMNVTGAGYRNSGAIQVVGCYGYGTSSTPLKTFYLTCNPVVATLPLAVLTGQVTSSTLQTLPCHASRKLAFTSTSGDLGRASEAL